MADASRVDIEGLRDLQRELRAIDPAFAKELRLANKEAAEVVAEATRASFSSRGGVAPKVASSVKVMAQQRSASVRIGGAKYPYAMGSNFGSLRYTQFPPLAKPDYSLFTSIEAKRDEVVDKYEEALVQVTKKAFPN
jgi:hypothetical protein